MALSATIYKANLSISDMDRGYYAEHGLTIAQHPSETLERMMLRVAAFALHASETLAFTKGLSADDEPELWQKNYSDEIELWIDLGEPDEKRVRKACGRADQVWLYCYGGRAAEIWWQGLKGKTGRFANLNVINIAPATLAELVALVERSMQLTATIQDGQMWLSSGEQSVLVEGERWQ
ncbi:YaeQ family protein [Crenobacter cavernae]|uniref:YaeQ family protein n=1 Tax=Crenobacter cavernae TaxID=2290923 RepID=A0ABY0FCD2_9NEIS|nr:YaeQ family protein [Crenobacter cavernae]RXZ43785.1 YaeQ family protein [Crenobacter cavernae]